ncbi:MAG: Mu-like prophage major head subunit gpT family protein [Thiohalocapsa sp.]
MSAANLDVAGLGAARAAIRKQKGPNGGYLNPVPRFLLVPAALETAALVLVAA